MDKPEARQWDGKSRGNYYGYLFFIYALKIFGIRGAYAFMSLIVIYFIPFARKSTAAVWTYNRRILHYGWWKSLRCVYLHYYAFGQVIIDKMALKYGLEDRYSFDFENYERFLQIINGNSGVIMIGAHVGCWEAGAGFFGKYGKKINVVMMDAEHRDIKKVMDRSPQERNFKVIPVNAGTLEAMVQIKLCLDAAEYVCFNGDRYLHRNSAVEMDFMGHKALFPIGPFRIASKCRVPVVFYYAMRGKGCRYRFIFKEARMDGKIPYTDLMRQYVESLEEVVNHYPRQWFNFYEFWNLEK